MICIEEYRSFFDERRFVVEKKRVRLFIIKESSSSLKYNFYIIL